MTNAKNVYALMLALVIVLSGCFGNAANDTDAQDSGTDGNDGESSSDTQDRTWYTSGGVYLTSWNMDGVESQGEYCIDWEETYSSETGELIDRHCNGNDRHSGLSDWNTTECTDQGGVVSPSIQAQNYPDNEYYAGYAPTCTLELGTVNTSSGEALLIYQFDSVSMDTTCDGVTVSSYHNSGNEYTIVSGSAMDCSHRLFKTIGYDNQQFHVFENEQSETMDIWSIVYAIQDVTVVE